MATKEQIKKAILEVAGNPDAGVVVQYAERWAEAIVKLDEPEVAAKEPVKEVRVTKPTETR